MKNFKWNLTLIILLAFVAACSPQPTKEVPQEFKKGQEYFHRVCSNESAQTDRHRLYRKDLYR
jgi:hypothetical protein